MARRVPDEPEEGLLERGKALVDSIGPGDVADLDAGARRTLLASNRWRHGSANVVGTAIGFRRKGGEWTDEPALVVFVRKKKDGTELGRDERVPRSLTVAGRRIATDVVELGRVRLDAALAGSQVVAEKPAGAPGTAAGILRDAEGNAFILSAAHVLGEFRKGPDRAWIVPGAPVFLRGAPEIIGRVADRAIPDFSNSYIAQNLDAAIARLDQGKAAGFLDPPVYRGPARAGLGDRVALSVPGDPVFRPVVYLDAAVRYEYLDGVRKRPQSVTLYAPSLAEYDSIPGDSGAMVYREGDLAAVGMHLAAQEIREGGARRWLAVFQPIEPVLARWPSMRLLHS